ncbi:MAG: VOC family protein [Anaerovoracaceae bacterium]
MIKKINHIGIVVPDFAKGKQFYGEYLGLEHLKDEVIPSYGCEIAFYQCGEAMLEIVHPISPGPSWNFLNEHGPGIHHICYEVDDVDEALKMAKEKFRTDYEMPDCGAGGAKVFFLDPSSIFNVETEFTGK